MATVRVFNHHLHSSFYWLLAVDAILFVLSFYAGTYLYFLSDPGGFQNYIGQIPARASLFAAVSVLCLAAMGLYVLPYRRSRVKTELRAKINELRVQLNAVLERQFESELQDSLQRIREAIAPYTRFVRIEREKIEKLEADLDKAGLELTTLRAEVEKLDRAQ